jgi:hypothetical protein
MLVRFDHVASFVKNADESVADCIAALPPKSQFRYGCLGFVTRTLFTYDYQISCPRVCNWTCHGLRCASSITHRERIARRITLTGGESCIALTRGVANGFAQSKTDSQEREGW